MRHFNPVFQTTLKPKFFLLNPPSPLGISKKFREFAAWVGSKGKSHSQLDVVDFSRVPANSGPLKSNLKKNLSSDLSSPSGNPAEQPGGGDSSDSNDNRKVHFNKFATVQMME